PASRGPEDEQGDAYVRDDDVEQHDGDQLREWQDPNRARVLRPEPAGHERDRDGEERAEHDESGRDGIVEQEPDHEQRDGHGRLRHDPGHWAPPSNTVSTAAALPSTASMYPSRSRIWSAAAPVNVVSGPARRLIATTTASSPAAGMNAR